MNTPSFATDPSGYRCSVVSFLLPSASSSPLLLASSVVFVRFLSLRSSPLPSLSHVSIRCCASLVHTSFSFIPCSALSTFPACVYSSVNLTLSSCSLRRVLRFRRVSPVYAYSQNFHGILYIVYDFEFLPLSGVFAFDVRSLTFCFLFCWPLWIGVVEIGGEFWNIRHQCHDTYCWFFCLLVLVGCFSFIVFRTSLFM